MLMATIFENEDLLSLILSHAQLSPREYVWASRVSKAWHDVCLRDGELALQAARCAHCLMGFGVGQVLFFGVSGNPS